MNTRKSMRTSESEWRRTSHAHLRPYMPKPKRSWLWRLIWK